MKRLPTDSVLQTCTVLVDRFVGESFVPYRWRRPASQHLSVFRSGRDRRRRQHALFYSLCCNKVSKSVGGKGCMILVRKFLCEKYVCEPPPPLLPASPLLLLPPTSILHDSWSRRRTNSFTLLQATIRYEREDSGAGSPTGSSRAGSKERRDSTRSTGSTRPGVPKVARVRSQISGLRRQLSSFAKVAENRKEDLIKKIAVKRDHQSSRGGHGGHGQ